MDRIKKEHGFKNSPSYEPLGPDISDECDSIESSFDKLSKSIAALLERRIQENATINTTGIK